jgi:hypothetical protein
VRVAGAAKLGDDVFLVLQTHTERLMVGESLIFCGFVVNAVIGDADVIARQSSWSPESKAMSIAGCG